MRNRPAAVRRAPGLGPFGVPLVDLDQDRSTYFDIHHTDNDTLEHVDRDALRQVTAAFATAAWWGANRDLTTAIVVGDCTDLCVYQLAMLLRLRANALNLRNFTVIVAANTVDTFDIPESPYAAPGSAHPGDFFHHVFLYHMAQNGIRIVRAITPS